MERSNNPVSSGGYEHGQTREIDKLLMDLRKMLNNPDLSDVVFTCQDRVLVNASRTLLMARSPKKGLSFAWVQRTRKWEGELPFLSTTLLSILEFLYTGTMIEHAPASPEKAHEIIKAAEYFVLPNVVKLMREFLVKADVADEMTKAALTLSVEVESMSSVELESMSSIPPSLRILSSGQLEPIHLRGLSEKAFRYFLRYTKEITITDPEIVSIREYLLFRNIILWCVTQVCPDEAAYAKWCLPDERLAANLLREGQDISKTKSSLPLPENSSREAGYLKSLLVRERESEALLYSLLKLVDYKRIRWEILIVFVEPLTIVPEAQLKGALRSHALHHKSPRETARADRQDHVSSPSVDGRWEHEISHNVLGDGRWEHGSSYSVVGDGRVIQKTKNKPGFARFTVPIARPDCVFEWDIVIEEPSWNFCEIGLLHSYGDGKPNFDGSTLAGHPMGWALNSEWAKNPEYSEYGIETRISQPGGGWKPFNKKFNHENARIKFQLDMRKRSCSFSVDGDDFLVAWENLPQGVTYFPAISLGKVKTTGRATGRVRIELVSGFDKL